MRQLINDLHDIKLAIFDLDGVIYRGQSLVPNADKIIEELDHHSIKIVYNSNNSTITRQMYVDRLKKFNIVSKDTDFYTSASITSAKITNIKKNATIFVVGEVGLKEELKSRGHNVITDPVNYEDVDFVIVGLDREFKYTNLAIAQRCILEGNAQFFATNADTTLPVARGLLPGAGVMVNALETCTNKKPIKIFGKPETFGIDLILKDFNLSAKEVCIFGDRLNTDILAGNRTGIKTIAVLTGVTSKEEIDTLLIDTKKSNRIDKNLIPDIVINSLDEIFK